MLKQNQGWAHVVVGCVKNSLAFGAESEDGEGGEGGNGEGGVDVNQLLQNPDIQKAIQAKIDAEVNGLKNKNAELKNEKKAAL